MIMITLDCTRVLCPHLWSAQLCSGLVVVAGLTSAGGGAVTAARRRAGGGLVTVSRTWNMVRVMRGVMRSR